MKKNGFTLVELLGTMVILAIVILIAVSGFGRVRENVQEKEHENLVKYIETKAANYASDTGSLTTNVDTLVKQGYIEADDEAGHVISPKDGSYLNCHIVSITKDENNLYGKYTEEEECDLDKLEIANLNFGVRVYKTKDNVTKEEMVESNKWVRDNVILEAYLKEGIKEEDIKSIKWKSNAGEETREVNGDFASKNEYVVKAEQLVNTTYYATIELKDGVSYQAQVIVKIDKQRPVIYDREINVENENEYTNTNKGITISASDGNGSGIYGYYVGTSNKCNEVEYEENRNNTYKVEKDEGIYYVCVRDNAGNVSEDESTKRIEIKNIDKTLPSCELEAIGTMGSNGYYISDIEIRMKRAIDNESGVNHTLINYPRVTNDTNGLEVTGTVVDNAGNSNTCKIVVKKDSYRPWINKKQEEIFLGTGDYDFRNNIDAGFGTSGGSVVCNPPSSLKTGKYTVTCTAIGNNGLQSSISFNVAHNYPATLIPKTCEKEESCNCREERVCHGGHGPCCDGGGGGDGSGGCNCPPGAGDACGSAQCCLGKEEDEEVCDKCTVEYDCSYYICPNGGTLNEQDNICYY